MTKLNDKGVIIKIIKSYLSEIKSYQMNIGLQNLKVFHHSMLKRIVAGIKKLIGEKDKRERKLITREILIQLLSNFDQKSLNEATLHAAYIMIFAAFLKCEEFTYTAKKANSPSFDGWHLIKKSIEFHVDKMVIALSASKTDFFRRGVVLTVASISDKACVIASMKNLFKKFFMPSNASLFHQSKGAFSRDFVVTNLRTFMKQLRFIRNYSGHFFRKNAATSVKEAGLSNADIQMLGK